MSRDPHKASRIRAFRCPLEGPCFSRPGGPFETSEAACAAVVVCQDTVGAELRAEATHALFLRYVPLMRKLLSRFCPRSRCYPGGCVVEELVGETYVIFQRAVDEYDASFGMDFLGFLSQRLRWGLLRSVDRLQDQQRRLGPPVEPDAWFGSETRLLNRLLVEELVASLSPTDADLVVHRYLMGFRGPELADRLGISHGAVRKRLERARRRLLENAGEVELEGDEAATAKDLRIA